MSDCCSSSCASQTTVPPKKHTCVSCGNNFLEVPYSTVLHHIRKPWISGIKEQAYYFCANPDCDTVYFGLDDSVITKAEVKTDIAIKEPDSNDALICFCFDVSNAEAKTNIQAKAFVVEQTKNGVCSCTTHNPSGRCCLKDFPK
ncbi:MAG: hypothetical protein OEX19_09245 [Gammaproteobacteria bacterium]|nr:hypothetical protein [Gammaproteobacteria bacterium]